LNATCLATSPLSGTTAEECVKDISTDTGVIPLVSSLREESAGPPATENDDLAIGHHKLSTEPHDGPTEHDDLITIAPATEHEDLAKDHHKLSTEPHEVKASNGSLRRNWVFMASVAVVSSVAIVGIRSLYRRSR